MEWACCRMFSRMDGFPNVPLTQLAGLRDQIGSHGNRNDSLWSRLILL